MMVRVARFPQPSRAWLGRVALERAGIQVELRGGDRSVLLGELPDAGGELWVEERDLERAVEALRLAETDSSIEGPDVVCAACAAPNPHGFERCWQCEAALGSVTTVPEGSEPVVEKPELPAKTKWGGAVKVIVAVVIAFASLKAYQWWNTPAPRKSRFTEKWVDSCAERRLAGVMHARFCDANGNGVYERIENYDARGKLEWVGIDENENEVRERHLHYSRSGALIAISVDRDEDGRSDEEVAFAHGQRTVFTDADGDGVFDRLVIETDGGTNIFQAFTPDGWRTQVN